MALSTHRAPAAPSVSLPTGTARGLEGCRILIVEDHWLVADEIADALQEAGAIILGPYPNMMAALDAMSDLNAIDCAVLDIGLGTTESFPLAEALTLTRVPFLFLTGLEQSKIPKPFQAVPHLLKPASADRLVRVLIRLSRH